MDESTNWAERARRIATDAVNGSPNGARRVRALAAVMESEGAGGWRFRELAARAARHAAAAYETADERHADECARLMAEAARAGWRDG